MGYLTRILGLAVCSLIAVAPAHAAGGGLGEGPDRGLHQGQHQGLGGGGSLVRHADHCVSPAERSRIMDAIERFEADHPWLAGSTGRGFPLLEFPFYPQAGSLYGDVFPNNFVDLDEGPGLLDWDCTDHTYDGHLGHDTGIRSFAEQAIGVPVFAALSGVVVEAQDGFFDMSTDFSNPQPANYVVLSHGSGIFTAYLHLRNGSVAVSLGDSVAEGAPLGLTASSGYSTGPHLHFEVFRSGVGAVEPTAGPCNPGGSWWANQVPIRRDLYIADFGFVQGDIQGLFQGPPYEFPRSSHLYDTRVFPDYMLGSYWVQGRNLPAGSTWRVRFRNPQGAIETDSGTRPFGFSTQDLRWWWAFWRYDIDAMRFNPGAWRFELSINGQVVVDAEVNAFFDEQPSFNRAPAPVSVAFDPPNPEQGETVFCVVTTDLVHDDPDFDVVRYRYRWTVNGQTVRDVVTAAHSDALASDQVTGDALVRCVVTPSDGSLNAPSASASAFVEGVSCGDADLAQPYGTLDLADVSAFVTGFTGMLSYADLNDDNTYDLGDIVAFVMSFGAGCP